MPGPRAVSGVAGVQAFTRAWTRVVTSHTVLRHSRSEVYSLLERFVRRVADALLAEPFAAAPGQRIGADLVAAGIATPELLGRTITLIAQRFLDDVRLDHPDARARLGELLGAVVTGYTGALTEQTVAAQEALRRAELVDRQWIEDALARSEQRVSDALLRHRLTGLPNRDSLLRRLSEALVGHAASASLRPHDLLAEPMMTGPSAPLRTGHAPQARLGLYLIDLDGFRTINDSLGYRSGDQVLCTVAHRLERLAAASGHFLAHVGTDAFALLIEDTFGPDEVSKAAEEALAAIAHTFPINNGYNLPIRASVGVVEQSVADTGPAALLGAAERALAWAKAECRGHWARFDPDRAAAEAARHALSAQMPDALTRGEFAVHYQPLVDLATGRIAGVEALVRWEHPVDGLLYPGRFIDLAEKTGLIVPLGEDVLRRACAQAVAWRAVDADHPVYVSVNIAAAQLSRPGLPAMISAILDETRLPARLLQLEVTENVLLDRAALGTLDELARTGVRIALDDFGTGNCRLAEISKLPVHTVKLAACFIGFLRDRDTAAGPDHTVLTAMIKLSQDLGLTVTAEGIETQTQVRRLLELGCDTGQGFHLGRPQPAEAITDLLMARARWTGPAPTTPRWARRQPEARSVSEGDSP
ncbi:putative bifunctional diguanylate cyclase/phosphodiesterase [Dactylosporangium sp. CA-233914]|uniref:putative bifunctional diguanylate cyclase/phosphodiesterase n=1 Tax=Dactylosporangium sp. CA-233914 TaxID=3239934 RepID=UPI003D8FEA5C